MGTGRHCSEDELILHYYGEGRAARHDVPRHLEVCGACRAEYEALASTLAMATAPETPERGDQYGLEVWQRIRHQLPERDDRWWSLPRWPGLEAPLTTITAASLIVAAFVAGRLWPIGQRAGQPPATAGPAAASEGAGEKRILLWTVADHLDRSERMLTEFMNAPGRDISFEQRWANDLLATSRVYRQDARDAGEPLVADVLDAVERSLLEIVHSPSQISPEALERLRYRIDAASLLFKVRVLGDELRDRNSPPLDRPATISPSSTHPS